jgi:uncharacterized membrane protein YdjX (TVP38/TMEM64 family)
MARASEARDSRERAGRFRWPPAQRPRILLFVTQTARRVFSTALLVVLAAGLAIPVVIWHGELWQLFASRDGMRDWVRGFGARAPLVYIAAQAFQVVIFAIPGEPVQIAGGMLFGGLLGTVYAVAGTVLGSAIAFALARLLGKPFVASFVSAERMAGIEKLLASTKALSVLFLLYLIPGIPKDVLCYVCGISPIRFPLFIIASTLARLPGLIGSAVIGGAAATHMWGFVVILSAVVLALFVAGLLLRTRLQSWIEGLADRKNSPKES